MTEIFQKYCSVMYINFFSGIERLNYEGQLFGLNVFSLPGPLETSLLASIHWKDKLCL